MTKELVRVEAPGKIILSGEHAVVYGAPALVMVVDRFSGVTVSTDYSHDHSHPNTEDIFFDLVDLNYQRKITLSELKFLQSQIADRYKIFLRKEMPISEVLQQPFELALCAVAYFFAKFGAVNAAKTFSLKLASNIPPCSGMGSSAAIIISILYALMKLAQINADDKVVLNLTREIESLQHGYSSGLDLLAVQRGGCVLFADGEVKNKKIPSIPMLFIHSGYPESTTGEGIEHAAHYFSGSELVKDFAALTYALDSALQGADIVESQRCIKENNKLLKYIGVVPLKVQEFIRKLERKGLAAKICGAGACRGDDAGVLLVVGEENADDCITDYDYSYLSLKGENSGVKFL